MKHQHTHTHTHVHTKHTTSIPSPSIPHTAADTMTMTPLLLLFITVFLTESILHRYTSTIQYYITYPSPTTRHELSSLQHAIHELHHQLYHIHQSITPQNFVEYSIIQRQIQKRQKEYNTLIQSARSISPLLLYTIPYLIRLIVYTTIIILYWNVNIARIPLHTGSASSSSLSSYLYSFFSTNNYIHMSSIVWLLICYRVVKRYIL